MHVNWRILAAVIMLFMVIASGMCSSIVMFRMVDEIIRRKSETDPISFLGYSLPKTRMIFREYQRLSPKGNLRFQAKVLFAAGSMALLACALLVGTI